MLRAGRENQEFARKTSRRELTLGTRGAVVALHRLRVPLAEITRQKNVTERSIYNTLDHVKGCLDSLHDGDESCLFEDDTYESSSRSGRPKILSKEDISTLIAHATENATTRRLTWTTI